MFNQAAVWRVRQYYTILPPRPLKNTPTGVYVGIRVCALVGDRLSKCLREYPAPDLDAPLIPIKMRAV